MLGIRQYRSTAIDLWCGDITSFACDVMVNAANESLTGGGGVNGAIRKIGGPSVEEECRKIGKCKTGQAVATTAGNLPAERLVHAVGPIWQGGSNSEQELLTSAYHAALKIVVKQDWQHVALPAISAGIYGYPIAQAAVVAVAAVKSFIDKKPPGTIRRVTFVLYDTETYDHFRNALTQVFGVD